MFRRATVVSGVAWALAWVLFSGSAQPASQPTEKEPTEHSEKAPLVGEAAEEFLRTAEISKSEPIPVGVTRPRRVTLTAGERTERGVFKIVNIFRPVQRFAGGGIELGFRDSYKNEIAAYELDKLIGLGMVPPTVERRWKRDRGSLQLWVDDVMTEAERMKRGTKPPDTDSWNEQMFTVRLIHQLLDDSDFNNVEELRARDDLERFSRSVLAKLRELDFDLMKKRLGRWLTKRQIESFLIRRDLILEHADQLVAEKGEEAVLYP
jgi:hypothetical protein